MPAARNGDHLCVILIILRECVCEGGGPGNWVKNVALRYMIDLTLPSFRLTKSIAINVRRNHITINFKVIL